MFHRIARNILTLVHGDDYCSAGTLASLDWLQAVLEKRYRIKTQRIGENKPEGARLAEGQVLNLVVRWAPDGYELEADLRHAELIIEHLELENS